jgi:nanoRNase/pAp phosphatase (c-di-AMP/oligoRNAs hydrolase)
MVNGRAARPDADALACLLAFQQLETAAILS